MSYTNRTEIPERLKWNLGDIYPTVEDWEKSFEEVCKHLDDFEVFKGKLNNQETILKLMKKLDEILVEVSKLNNYTFLNYCEDTKDIGAQTRHGKIESVIPIFEEKISFVDPELSKLSEEEFNNMIANPDFSDYTERLKELRDGKAHILSENEEKLLAWTGDFSRYFQEIFNRLNNGDIDFGNITVDGKELKLTHGSYSMCMQNHDRSVRKAAFDQFNKGYIELTNTLSGIYEGSVKKTFLKLRQESLIPLWSTLCLTRK